MRRYLALLAGAALAFGMASPAMAAPTGGSGGPLTDRLNQSFSANGITSTYHIFADGIDTSKEVGLLYYTDGSGGYGLDNPNSTYLLDADGTNGLRQVARDNNMILLTPFAPAPGCDGSDNCWYNTSSSPNATAKADWARALVDQVYSQYNIEKDRVAIGGYSSGAQHTTRWFVPRHGSDIQTGGVFVAISYGGAPAVAGDFPQSYKDAVHGYWNTGTSDSAYSTASYGAIGGYNWYRDNGFNVSADWPAGVGHGRSGEFDDIMRAQIAAHVRPAGPAGGSTPTEPEAPAAWETTVDPTRNGGTFSVNVPDGYSGRVYIRLSNGYYVYNYFTGPTVAQLTFSAQSCGQTLGWRTQAPSGTDRDSGTFSTDPC